MSQRPIRLRVSLTVAEAEALVRAAEYAAKHVDVLARVHPRIGQRHAARRAVAALEEAVADARAGRNARLFPGERSDAG